MAKKLQGEPRYQVPRELADSLAFRSLPAAAKILWHDLMMQYRGGNNGNINAALSELKHYNWRSSTTIAKGLRYLIAHGLITETRTGGHPPDAFDNAIRLRRKRDNRSGIRCY